MFRSTTNPQTPRVLHTYIRHNNTLNIDVTMMCGFAGFTDGVS